MLVEIEKLAYWAYNEWSGARVLEIFKPEDKYEEEYWLNKFDRNILSFYLSLDRNNKAKFERYIEKEFGKYDPYSI